MSRRFLAVFLGIAMSFFQIQEFTVNVCAASTTSANNSSGERSQSAWSALKIGGGVLALVEIPFAAWGIYNSCKNSTEYIMRWVIDTKNNPPAGWPKQAVDYKIYNRCDQENMHPESVFVHVSPKNRDHVAACYYGKDAFKNCIADAENDDLMNGEFGVSYAHSTQVIWYESVTDKYMYRKPDREFNIQGNLKRFVEFCGGIYEAEYRNVNSEGEAPDWRLVIIDLTQQDRSGRNKSIGTLVETDTGEFEFHEQGTTGDINRGSYSKSIPFIKQFCLSRSYDEGGAPATLRAETAYGEALRKHVSGMPFEAAKKKAQELAIRPKDMGDGYQMNDADFLKEWANTNPSECAAHQEEIDAMIYMQN